MTESEWLKRRKFWSEEQTKYEKQKFMVKIMGSSMAIILMIHHQTLVQYHLLMNFVPSVSGSQQRQW